MGKLGKHLKCVIGKFIVQMVEPYLGLNLECKTAGASGEDCPPIKNDRIVLVKLDGTGEYVAVGVVSVSQGAKPGEKILYSRDSDGNIQAVLKMLNDGAIDISGSGEIKVKGKTMNLESEKTVFKGGQVQCNGIVSPNAQGPFCGLPNCLFTGAPQTGNIASGK